MTIWPKNLFKAKNLTQKFITRYKIDRNIYFPAEEEPLKWHMPYPNICEFPPPPPPSKDEVQFPFSEAYTSQLLDSNRIWVTLIAWQVGQER